MRIVILLTCIMMLSTLAYAEDIRVVTSEAFGQSTYVNGCNYYKDYTQYYDTQMYTIKKVCSKEVPGVYGYINCGKRKSGRPICRIHKTPVKIFKVNDD